MKLFVKNKEKSGWKDRAANRIVRGLLHWQEKCSRKVNVFFATKSTKVMKRYLAIFCITGGCFSGYVLFDSLLGKARERTGLGIGQTSVPNHITRGGDEPFLKEQRLDNVLQSEVVAFKNFLDSLRQNSPNSYDSLVKVRPGLLDSLQLLEELYFQNNKTDVYEP